MKTEHRSDPSRGIGTIQLLVIALVVAMLGFAAVRAMRSQQSVSAKYDLLSQSDLFGTEPTAINDFYDCVDQVKSFNHVMPQTCEYMDKTYTRPVDFTQDNVRNFNRVPESAKATVLVIARKNFDICKDVPETLSITKILNVVDGYVYLATGCDGGFAEILVRQGLAWKEINLGQGGLACATVKEHRIPHALVYNESVADSGKCFDDKGRKTAFPE